MIQVLILEDDAEIRELINEIVMEREGFETILAANTKEAYLALQSCTIDIFILDVNLEETNHLDRGGFYFAKSVRNIQKYAFSPIIFITSMSSMEILLYREVQCYQYISKPFNSLDVTKILDKAVNVMSKKIYEKSPKWIVRKEGVCYPLNISDTVYVESVLRSLRIRLDGQELEVPYMKLEDALKELENYGFVQCHRGIVVNIEFVEKYDPTGHYLALKNDNGQIDVGRTYIDKFNEMYGVERKKRKRSKMEKGKE